MTSNILSPKESGELIARLAKHVKLDPLYINYIALMVAKALVAKTLTIEGFSQFELHPSSGDYDTANYLFYIDTLNFCFWSPTEDGPKWTVSLNGKPYTGYFALCAAMRRAKQEGHDIASPHFFLSKNLENLREIFRSDTTVEIPLLQERLDCLHEVSKVLINEFDGDFKNCIKQSDKSAVKLLSLIVTKFPCFRDEANYKGYRVSLYKRAQILVGDIWACYQGTGLGEFHDIDQLTMFADYRVPQVLIKLGAMSYSDELLEKLKKGVLLEAGCEEEVEIRGCSIYIVEKVVDDLKIAAKGDGHTQYIFNSSYKFNSVMVDHFLWDYRREHANEMVSIPFHRTKGIYY